jgi:hypothetical protein
MNKKKKNYPSHIKAGDTIIMPKTDPITPYGELRVSYISNFDDTIIFDDGGFLYKYNLLSVNKKNQKSLNEIEVGIPSRTWDFTKYISNFNYRDIKRGTNLPYSKIR